MTGDLFQKTSIRGKKNELRKQDYKKLKDKQGNKNTICIRCKERQHRQLLSHEKERRAALSGQVQEKKILAYRRSRQRSWEPTAIRTEGQYYFPPNSHTLFPRVSSGD